MKKWLFGLFLLAIPSVALAQEVPNPDDLGALVDGLVEAVKGSEWSVVVSLALMIAIFLLTKVPVVRDWLPAKARPWVAAIAGVVLAVVTTALTTGDWLTAALNGLTTGAAASGLWSLIGKRLLQKEAEVK